MSFWTPEIEEELKACVIRGDSAGDIAKAFNTKHRPEKPLSRSAVTGKVHRMGLVLGKHQGTPEQITRRVAARKAAQQRRLSRAKNAPKPSPTFIIGNGPPARAPKTEAPKVRPISTAPTALAIAFEKRKPSQCAYIWDESPTAHSLCCGAPVKAGSKFAFCPAHLARIVLNAPTRRELAGEAA